jgi:hypothetical protein
MSKLLRDIIQNVKDVSMSDSAISTMLDFERVLDEMDLYAFRNWKLGELIDGPRVKKYRVACTFMWPFSLMPDPSGAERLLNFGAQIRWGRDWLEYPVKIQTPDDYRPGTKKPRLARRLVWTVEITLPKNLIKNIQRGSKDILDNTLDLEDIDAAYERGLDQQGVDAHSVQTDLQSDMSTSAGQESM